MKKKNEISFSDEMFFLQVLLGPYSYIPFCWREQVWAAGKHKRRINCGAWSYQNQLAYGSDDKQISVTSETGQIQDQVCRHIPIYSTVFMLSRILSFLATLLVCINDMYVCMFFFLVTLICSCQKLR